MTATSGMSLDQIMRRAHTAWQHTNDQLSLLDERAAADGAVPQALSSSGGDQDTTPHEANPYRPVVSRPTWVGTTPPLDPSAS